ncbi:pyridine nucleotide-disulfide oxidoreductase domain-containing protein 1-like [Acanthaster planci]|uniref:Pyridine nucleotide-disulfide oxidoreductase domain-containing protein 1 n=1 Tax=Acanthaster planci TaxID=133434 RepID=A0A8B7ZNP8_ACAPL|nr:pyridine nucleotide-disulfide oxidoreductase domain-containing protein 1-like [Acanthaster planci]
MAEARIMEGSYMYVVIGGGIAGVTCAEQLSALCPEEQILLVTSSPLIKAVTNFTKISRALEEFDVEERPASSMQTQCTNVQVLQCTVDSLDAADHRLTTREGSTVAYRKLCICTGGQPKVIARDNPYVLGIRDTESVVTFQKRMSGAKRVVVVGNGGIATELVYEIEGCQVVWAIKDDAISSTFVDAGAAEFFLPQLSAEKETAKGPLKRHKYTVSSGTGGGSDTQGGALGPDWSTGLMMKGQAEGSHNIRVEYKCEVDGILTPEQVATSGRTPDAFLETQEFKETVSWPVYVSLTNGKLYGCDFVISATGVTPNAGAFLKTTSFNVAEDGGLKVDDHMRTNVPDIYAAGDVCTASWDPAPHWLQMRLWSQARQMGAYAAKCMVANVRQEPISQDFCFELFAHATRFFGYKVVLLGKFNAQGLGSDYEMLLRMTKGEEYVKAVLKDGRMQGAVLIGETDLEETFENLILNKIDLSAYGENLLDPNIDIEDYFD